MDKKHTDLLAKAAQLGADTGGRVDPGPRTPCQSAGLMELIGQVTDRGASVPLMQAYTRAFDAAYQPFLDAELRAAGLIP